MANGLCASATAAKHKKYHYHHHINEKANARREALCVKLQQCKSVRQIYMPTAYLTLVLFNARMILRLIIHIKKKMLLLAMV